MRNNIDVCKLQTDCTPTCGAAAAGASQLGVCAFFGRQLPLATRGTEIERQSNGDAADDWTGTALQRLRKTEDEAGTGPGLELARATCRIIDGKASDSERHLKGNLLELTADPKRRCRCCWCCCSYCCCGNILQECCGISTERPMEACCMCIIKKNQVGLFEFCLL